VLRLGRLGVYASKLSRTRLSFHHLFLATRLGGKGLVLCHLSLHSPPTSGLPGVVVLLVGSLSQESDLCSNERSRTSTATHPSVQRPGSALQPATVTSEFDKSLFAAYTLAITLLLILLFLKSSDPRPSMDLGEALQS
jgi:hypothetical protein